MPKHQWHAVQLLYFSQQHCGCVWVELGQLKIKVFCSGNTTHLSSFLAHFPFPICPFLASITYYCICTEAAVILNCIIDIPTHHALLLRTSTTQHKGAWQRFFFKVFSLSLITRYCCLQIKYKYPCSIILRGVESKG